MHICDLDRGLVKWAVDHGYLFKYVRQPTLSEPCLEINIGFITAYFHEGKLVRLMGTCEGNEVDQIMYDLALLFGLCRREDAYLQQRTPVLRPFEIARRESA